MRANRFWTALLLLLIGNVWVSAKSEKPLIDTSQLPPRPNKAAVFFYRMSEWVDHFVMKDIDTTYISLPEHSWRFAFNTSMVGIHSMFKAGDVSYGPEHLGNIHIRQQTTPSVNLGFYAGYRGFGFGYSWDALHAYSQNMNFSLGGKRFGLEFMRQSSYNLNGVIGTKDIELPFSLYDSIGSPIRNSITNTTVSFWYALNATHYSHNAALKQSYIQKKTAGSLLLQLAYMSTSVRMDNKFSELIGKVESIETHQVGVGLGYGINYTPNKGKILLHLSGVAQLICFSHNLISEQYVDSVSKATYYELFRIQSRYPVHVTGTLRAAFSWEINRWVHLHTWAQVNNVRFMANASNARVDLSNWNWQVNLAFGVRLGAGYARRQKVLDAEEDYLLAEEREILREAAKIKIQENKADSILVAVASDIQALNAFADSVANAQLKEANANAMGLRAQSANRKRKLRRRPLPEWLTDYFYSPLP